MLDARSAEDRESAYMGWTESYILCALYGPSRGRTDRDVCDSSKPASPRVASQVTKKGKHACGYSDKGVIEEVLYVLTS